MKPVLSFIVPIYNVEKFLAKCLNSVIDNNWQQMNYEIIIVDDASPDQSLNIANEFVNQYQNITIISQENKGLGGARNTGITKAKGDYLFFLDSDDFLKPNEIQELIKIATNNNLDLLEFGADRVDQHYRFIDQVFKKENSLILDGLSYIAKYNFDNSACNKLYKRSFIVENEIVFFENTYIEDAPFNAEAFSKAQRVQSVPNTPIIFYQNQNSITRKKRTGENLKKFVADSIRVTNQINHISTVVDKPDAKMVFQKRVALFTSGILLMIIRSNLSITEKKAFVKELMNNDLYPISKFTDILQRDLFISIFNIKFILQLSLKILK
jgi:glycosyltransferase involved in cell wall biosynthesis